MRKPVIAGNWKMHTSGTEAESLARAIREQLPDVDVDAIVCPPFVWLERVGRVLDGSRVMLGAQDVFWEEKGAYTGEVSPAQLAELCGYVIVGHSERRRVLGETDEMVARKCAAASAAGLTPILAVGEDAEEYERGEGPEVVRRQLRAAEPARCLGRFILAYEPIWAIGSGTPATPEDAQRMAALLRDELAALDAPAADVPILYGGSVTAESFRGFVGQPDIDGALVGGASLKANEFAEIIRIAGTTPT